MIKNNVREENIEFLNVFFGIAMELLDEKDVSVLLNKILDHCMTITNSDAGSLFIINDDEGKFTYYEKNTSNTKLQFMLAKNNSIPVALTSTEMEITGQSIIGASVIFGDLINIEDAYHIPSEKGYKFNKTFDEETGYKTKSILTIPMKDRENQVIGVIQLINKKINSEITTYSELDESLISALGGLCTVILENQILYQNLTEMIEANRNTVINEINKRKAADDEINKLLSAVELSPVGVMITDTEGKIIYVNPKFEKLTDYNYSDIIGKNPRILKSGNYSKRDYRELWNTILEGEEWHGELYNKKKDGSYYWANCHIAPVSEDGDIRYFVAVQEDVTDKKQLIDELNEKNIVLEETLRKLNNSQMQVIHSEKLAGIGQLAAGVAHEINNPLAFVISNYKSLGTSVNELVGLNSENQNIPEEKSKEMDSLTEDISEILEDSEEGLIRVRNIINALKVFSTIDQTEIDVKYNLNMNIENVLLLMQNDLRHINITKDFQVLPLINATAKEFNQVILNLLKNALYAIKDKFDSKEGGSILMKTTFDNKNVVLEIIDNGIGMASDIMNKIYEPFFTTKPIGVGPGLGLGVVYDVITNKHKGSVVCESTNGVGSKFIITVPII